MHPPINIADGETLQLGRIDMSAASIEAFAAAYDPQPQHLDHGAAMQTLLEGQAASGWHTCALLMHQVKRFFAEQSLHIELPAIDDIRWLRPVRPKDILTATMHWISKCRLPGCAISGGWAVALQAVNQENELVLRVSGNALLADSQSSIEAIRRRALGCATRKKRSPRARRRPGGHLVRYFEDVELGDEIALGSYHFNEPAIRSYTNIVDGSAGSAGDAGVNNWHLVSAWMRRIVDYYQAECEWLKGREQAVPLLGPAAGARCMCWCGNVAEGDRITFTSWAEHKINVGTSSEWGLLVAGAEGVNERGEVVLSFYPQFLLQKRPA